MQIADFGVFYAFLQRKRKRFEILRGHIESKLLVYFLCKRKAYIFDHSLFHAPPRHIVVGGEQKFKRARNSANLSSPFIALNAHL